MSLLQQRPIYVNSRPKVAFYIYLLLLSILASSLYLILHEINVNEFLYPRIYLNLKNRYHLCELISFLNEENSICHHFLSLPTVYLFWHFHGPRILSTIFLPFSSILRLFSSNFSPIFFPRSSIFALLPIFFGLESSSSTERVCFSRDIRDLDGD